MVEMHPKPSEYLFVGSGLDSRLNFQENAGHRKQIPMSGVYSLILLLLVAVAYYILIFLCTLLLLKSWLLPRPALPTDARLILYWFYSAVYQINSSLSASFISASRK